MKRPQFKNNGVKSKTLLGLVQGTAPFLFEDLSPEVLSNPAFRYVQILRDTSKLNDQDLTELDSDLWSYFELCLAAHFATVGTFVPTDVDLAIRLKLWQPVHHLQSFEPMWTLVQEFATWDESLVSRRVTWIPEMKSSRGSCFSAQKNLTQKSLQKNESVKLSGHQGEWFSVATAAYGCALKVANELIPEIRNEIESLVDEHEEAIESLMKNFTKKPEMSTAKLLFDGIAAVAHNLGDLDRMFEAWNISESDVLKSRVFRAGHEDALKPRPVLMKAGAIYQVMLANENHRHYALRDAKCLRKSPEFLLSYGPFLDDWGTNIIVSGVNTGRFTERELRDICEALIEGWKKLNTRSIYISQGYARALAGIGLTLAKESDPTETNELKLLNRSRAQLEKLLPPVLAKEITSGGLRTLLGISRAQFEKTWVTKLKNKILNEEETDLA